MSTYNVNDYVFSKSSYEAFYIQSIRWNPSYTLEEYILCSLKNGYTHVSIKKDLDFDYLSLSINNVYIPRLGSGMIYDVSVSYYDAVNETLSIKNAIGVVVNMDAKTFFNTYEEKPNIHVQQTGWAQYTPTGVHIPPKFKINDVVALEINGAPFSVAISDVDLSKQQYSVTYDNSPVTSNISTFKTGRIDIQLLDFIFAISPPAPARPLNVTTNISLPKVSNFQIPDHLTGKLLRQLPEGAQVNVGDHRCEDNWTEYHGFTETYEYCKICDKRK